MLERFGSKYWPLALLLLLIVAILCVSRYAENCKAKHQENAQASGPQSGVCPPNADKSAKETNQSKYPPNWTDTFAWPDGVTAWALLLTLLVIAWQSAETRDSAKAALMQSEHTETTERAWLIVNFVSMKDRELKDGEIADCRWAVKNVGATPGILLETKTRFHVFRLYDGMPDDPVKQLSAIPDYGNPITVNERLLAPQDSMGYFAKWERFIDGQFSEFAFPAGANEIWMVVAYGYVKYRDIFGKERESRSCDFTLVGRDDKIIVEFRPHPKAPAAYNRCT